MPPFIINNNVRNIMNNYFFVKKITSLLSLLLFLSINTYAGQQRLGPVGGSGGSAWEDPGNTHVNKIYMVTVDVDMLVRAGDRIDAIGFQAHGGGAANKRKTRYGGSGGKEYRIPVNFKCITSIEGTTGFVSGRGTESIFSLKMNFIDGSSTKEFGKPGNKRFKLEAPTNHAIIGFFGRSGAELDAIGVITDERHPKGDIAKCTDR